MQFAIDSVLPPPYRLPAVEEGAPIAYDLLINNGTVIDGTGATPMSRSRTAPGESVAYA